MSTTISDLILELCDAKFEQGMAVSSSGPEFAAATKRADAAHRALLRAIPSDVLLAPIAEQVSA